MFGPGNLKITTATEQEAAKYTCKVQSGGAEMTADATVSVIGKFDLCFRVWGESNIGGLG